MLHKKSIRFLLIVMAICICSILIEVLVFNYNYLINRNHVTEYEGNVREKLILNDILETEKGVYTITGDNPYFEIDLEGYCRYLKINTKNGENYQLDMECLNDSGYEQEKTQKIGKTYDGMSVIRIDENIESMRFVPVLSKENNNAFTIEKIQIVNDFFVNYYRLFCMVSVGVLIAGLFVFGYRLKNKLHLIFALLIMTVGVNYLLENPTCYSFDEKEHFIRAYEVSRFDFGFSGGEKIMWPDNIDVFLDWEGKVPYQTLVEKNNYFKQFSTVEYEKEEHYSSTADTYLFIPYLAGGIGIAFGRMVGLPFLWTFLMGRAFSLLFYGIVCAWCIKKIKYGKRLLFLLALLPGVVALASSYSADGFLIAFSFVVMTLWVNMMTQEEKISGGQLALFCLSIGMVVMCKMTYAPLCMLIFTLPGEKFVGRLGKWYSKCAVVVFTGIVAAGTFVFSNIKNINQWHLEGVDTSGQVSFVLKNPFEYAGILLNHIRENIFGQTRALMIGLAYNGEMKEIFFIILFVAILVIVFADEELRLFALSVRNKIWIGIGAAGSWVLVITALYVTFTPVGQITVDGVQGRYLAPLLFPFFMILNTDKIQIRIRQSRLEIFTIIAAAVPLLAMLYKMNTLYY